MFDAYFEAVRARNQLITDTMIRNQRLIADLFARHLDFGADFLQHQMRVLSIITQWRAPAPAVVPAETPPGPPTLTLVKNRR